MLPDFEPQDIKLPDAKPAVVVEDVKTQEEAVVVAEETAAETTPEAPGAKTNSTLLLQALKEEREKRKAADAEVARLKANPSPQHFDLDDASLSDEGRSIKAIAVEALSTVATLREELETSRVLSTYPQLKDKTTEFESYRADYPGVPMEKVAKLYLAENELLEGVKPARKGLEVPTGGSKVAQPTGHTKSEVAALMQGDPRKLQRMLLKGELDPDKIR